MDISTIWAGFGNFLKAWGPWITTALIPTLIVGLSQSAKTQGAVAWLKYVLQFLSFVSPKDAPGTFKLPLTAVTPHPATLPPKTDPPAKTDTDKTISGPPPTTTILLLIGALGFSYFLSGCAWIGSIAKGSKEGVIDCSAEAIKSDTANLIVTVHAILTGGAINWNEQLDALKEMGEDALACALYIVGDQLQADSVPPADTAGDSPTKMKMRATAAEGHNKALTYVHNHKWQPTNIPPTPGK